MSTPQTLHWPKIIIQSTALAVALLILPILILTFVFILRVSPFIDSFFVNAGITPRDFIGKLQTGWQQSAPIDDGAYALVVLGSDELPNRQHMPVMTDTVMLVVLNLRQGSIKTLTIPRDYWSEQFQTKINGLFELGRKQNPDKPYELLLRELQTLTPTKFKTVVMVSPVALIELIDTLGGIEIDVPVGFRDAQFPRDGVDIIKEHDPEKLYETIEFSAGIQRMNGQKALQYMRSRHGTNGQDNDLERAKRQSQVIRSVGQTLFSDSLIRNPVKMGQLWQHYQKNYGSALSFETIMSLLRYRIEQVGWKGTLRATVRANTEFTISQSQIPVTHYSSITKKIEPGILFNPPLQKKAYYGQWVYIATDSAVLSQYVTNSTRP